MLRELAAAAVQTSRLLKYLLSRCTASRSPQPLRNIGQVVAVLSSSGAWLAFVVLRVINVVVSRTLPSVRVRLYRLVEPSALALSACL